MKTKKEVLKDNSQYKALINAVVSRVGLDSVEDINRHGISGGYGGFIYYSDTTAFFRKYKKDILKMAEEMADSMGEDMLTMIRSFNCLGNNYTVNEIGQAIYAGKGDYVDQIQNAMAWFAAEEVCRMFED